MEECVNKDAKKEKEEKEKRKRGQFAYVKYS